MEHLQYLYKPLNTGKYDVSDQAEEVWPVAEMEAPILSYERQDEHVF